MSCPWVLLQGQVSFITLNAFGNRDSGSSSLKISNWLKKPAPSVSCDSSDHPEQHRKEFGERNTKGAHRKHKLTTEMQTKRRSMMRIRKSSLSAVSPWLDI
jgi:hypothetical protein